MKKDKIIFQKFVKIAKEYIECFGIKDWKIIFEQKKLDSDTFASTSTLLSARIATITFCESWPVDIDGLPTEKKIRNTAIHEVLHVVLAPLTNLLIHRDRKITYDEIEIAEHGIVQRLLSFLKK